MEISTTEQIQDEASFDDLVRRGVLAALETPYKARAVIPRLPKKPPAEMDVLELEQALEHVEYYAPLDEGQVISWRSPDRPAAKTRKITDCREHCREYKRRLETLDLRATLKGKCYYSADQVAEMWEQRQREQKQMDVKSLRLRVPKAIPDIPVQGVWTEPAKRSTNH